MIGGVIEGFYGPPWTHEERLDLIRFCAAEGLTTWVHAPKDDPYHRDRWSEPYPDDELARLGELAHAAREAGVDFAYAIAPGLSICYSQERDFEQLVAKCEQVRSVGVSTFQLLWDDVEHTFSCAQDDERYGHEERPSAAAQAELSNRFAASVDQTGRLVVCPMGYAGTGDSAYRRVFRRLLDPGIVAYWTGPEVVSLAIAREELDAAVARFGDRDLLIWDNYPVNDFDPGRLFLGPLRGRDPRLASGRLVGLIANAMLQAVPSKLALATVADFVRDPGGYDALRSFGRALRLYGRRGGRGARPAGAAARRGRAPGGSRRAPRGARSGRRRGHGSCAARTVRMSDVCVYGATAAGVAAAVGAAEAGAAVTVVEPGRHVGGMVSGGLSWSDVGDERVLGGFARRFYAAVADPLRRAVVGAERPRAARRRGAPRSDARRHRRAAR